VHNSHRPLAVIHFVTLDLNWLTRYRDGQDNTCAKFVDCSFSGFGRADRQTDRITHGIADVDDCYTQATTVGVSKYVN